MENNLVSAAGFLISSMFGVLAIVIGWIGSRLIVKQDETLKRLDAVKDELHKRITSLDHRVVRIETLMYDA